MIKGRETKLVCKCERCGHEWVSLKGKVDEIKVCAQCKSPYWNTPKIKRGNKGEKESKEAEKKQE